MQVLNEMNEHQNREQQKRLLGDNDVGAADIESQMMVKERKGASRGVKIEGFK